MMNTKILSLGLLTTILLVAGCTTSPSVSEIEIVPTEEIVETQVPVYTVGESTCDNYLATLSCIANAMSDSESDELSRTIDSVYQSFTDVPVDQLIETCTILSQALRSHPTMLQEYAECNMLVDIVE